MTIPGGGRAGERRAGDGQVRQVRNLLVQELLVAGLGDGRVGGAAAGGGRDKDLDALVTCHRDQAARLHRVALRRAPVEDSCEVMSFHVKIHVTRRKRVGKI